MQTLTSFKRSVEAKMTFKKKKKNYFTIRFVIELFDDV